MLTFKCGLEVNKESRCPAPWHNGQITWQQNTALIQSKRQVKERWHQLPRGEGMREEGKKKKNAVRGREEVEANCRGKAEQGIHRLTIPPSSKARVEL